MDYSKIPLGELLSSENITVRRHATGILKQLQKKPKYLACIWCGKEMTGPYAQYCSLKCRDEAQGKT